MELNHQSAIKLRTVPRLARLHGGMEGHVSRDCSMEAKVKSCYKCGLEGHISRDCTQNNSGYGAGFGSSGTECYRCGKVGHIARACPEGAGGNAGYGGGGFGGFGGGGKTW
ncbi:hypothetical protein F5J12DRAFT_475168 [Pisolithus orientalis]|uniref:uncharacterized protein n=1 Tax=Pisolithus orientalis TaxID=936130 RepID=UPI0022255C15|nr:uncharacterized protein F5J12DRAFT_475168 [Pisolithus orientalis]KAI5990541.1 hypothetical protein F5J12DRAFT_475168 [Pisolithus orientalis]